jgi:glycine cleavage system H protein
VTEEIPGSIEVGAEIAPGDTASIFSPWPVIVRGHDRYWGEDTVSQSKTARKKSLVVSGATAREGTALGTVPRDGQACIWMRAQVLSYRLCDRDFDCDQCPLDAALHGRGQGSTVAQEPGGWGQTGYRLYPQDRQFSPGHAWACPLDANAVRVGVDALVAWLVARTVGVKLPKIGSRIGRGDVVATLLVDGGQLEVHAPVSGIVLAHNTIAIGCPELVAAAPYGAGWLVDIGIGTELGKEEMDRLLCGPDMETLSRVHLHEFHSRTDTLLAGRDASVGATMADGGTPLSDPRAMLGARRYLELVQELLT